MTDAQRKVQEDAGRTALHSTGYTTRAASPGSPARSVYFSDLEFQAAIALVSGLIPHQVSTRKIQVLQA